jgi:hypothetical protein
MDKQIQNKANTAKVAISFAHNERLNELLLLSKREEPLARLTKQKLVEYAIDKITDEDTISLSKRFRDRKTLILEYLKKDQRVSDPEALISILKQEMGK